MNHCMLPIYLFDRNHYMLFICVFGFFLIINNLLFLPFGGGEKWKLILKGKLILSG